MKRKPQKRRSLSTSPVAHQAQNISISLEGTPDTNANGTSAAVLALSDAADTAKGVGIEVFSSLTAPTEGTQLTFDKQSKTAVSQADENGDIAF